MTAPLPGLETADAVKAAKLGSNFSSQTEETVGTMPPSIQLKYLQGSPLEEGGYSAELEGELLSTNEPWGEVTRKVSLAFAGCEEHGAHSYFNFIEWAESQESAASADVERNKQRWAAWRQVERRGICTPTPPSRPLSPILPQPAAARRDGQGGSSGGNSSSSSGSSSSSSGDNSGSSGSSSSTAGLRAVVGITTASVTQAALEVSGRLAAVGAATASVARAVILGSDMGPTHAPSGPEQATPRSSSPRRHNGSWPDWRSFSGGGVLSAPSCTKIKTYFKHAYRKIEGYLAADLLSRVPGEHASSDATFRAATRTTSDDEGCLVFILGEEHSICRFFYLDSDSDEALLPGLRRWAQQLKGQLYYNRKENRWVNAYDALKYWHDDRCCRGGDPLAHPYVQIFNIDRAPYADGWHKVDLPSKTFWNPELKGAAKARLGKILRAPYEPDVDKVVRYLQKRSRKRILDPDEARGHALKRHRSNIRRSGRVPPVLVKDLEDERDGLQAQLVTWNGASPDRRQQLGRPVYRNTGHNGEISSYDEMGNVIDCARKGCISDCRKLEDCYIELGVGPLTGLETRIKKTDSTKNEAWHRLVNLLLSQISRIKSENLEPRIMLRIFRHNWDNDIRLGRKPSSPRIPFWRLAALRRAAQGCTESAAELYSGMILPSMPSLREPQGVEYNTLRLAGKLEAVYAASPTPVPAAAPVPAIVGATSDAHPTGTDTDRTRGRQVRSITSTAAPKPPASREDAAMARQALARATAEGATGTDLWKAAAAGYNSAYYDDALGPASSSGAVMAPSAPVTAPMLMAHAKRTVKAKKDVAAGALLGAVVSGRAAERAAAAAASAEASKRPRRQGSASSTPAAHFAAPAAAAASLATEDSSAPASKKRKRIVTDSDKEKAKVRKLSAANAADEFVQQGNAITSDNIDMMTFYQLGAFLKEMKKGDSAVISTGNALGLRVRSVLDFFARSNTSSFSVTTTGTAGGGGAAV